MNVMPNRIAPVKNPSWINRKLIAPARREAAKFERWIFPNPEALSGFRPALVEGPNDIPSHIALMETSNPVGSSNPPPSSDGLKEEVLTLFQQKLPEADLSNLKTAFKIQERLGINLALRAEGIELLMMWNVSPNAVAAFILCPAKAADLQGRIDQAVLKLITRKKSLDNFSFNPDLGRKQGSKFIKMLMLREKDMEALLLKTADLFQQLAQSAGKTNPAAPLALHAFAPFLKILGYHIHASQLEDLAFLNSQPTEFKATESQTMELFRVNKAYLLDELKTLAECLVEDLKIEHRIIWGMKNIYQTYLKEQSAADVNDFLRLRVVVKDEMDCFNAQTEIIRIMSELGYRRLPHLCDDYINVPTPTGYRALHENFEEADEGWVIEIQIRSDEMDREAEIGGCSHLSYKLSKYGFDDITLGFVEARKRYELNRKKQEKHGMIYAYDADGGLHKVGPVTKVGREPSVLDFAFHLSRDAGRRTTGAEITRLDPNGKWETRSAGFSTLINSGDKIRLKIVNEPQPITRRRLEAATTEIAIASLGLLQTGKEVDIDRRYDDLREMGSQTFNKEVKKWEETLLDIFKRLSGKPGLEKRFSFSIERVFKKLGLPDPGTFYTAVGLRVGKRAEFLPEVMSIIQDSSVVVGYESKDLRKSEANLYVLLNRKAGVILRLMRLLDIYGMGLKDFSIGSSEGDYTLVRLRVTFGTAEMLQRFLNKLEDLYKNIPLIPQSPHKKKVQISVKLKEDQLLGFLEMILQLGGQIIFGKVQTKRIRKKLDVNFEIAFPAAHVDNIIDRIAGTGKQKYKKITIKEV